MSKNRTSTEGRAKRASMFRAAAAKAMTDKWGDFWRHLPDEVDDDPLVYETLDYYLLRGGNGNPSDMTNDERYLLLCLIAARAERP